MPVNYDHLIYIILQVPQTQNNMLIIFQYIKTLNKNTLIRNMMYGNY